MGESGSRCAAWYGVLVLRHEIFFLVPVTWVFGVNVPSSLLLLRIRSEASSTELTKLTSAKLWFQEPPAQWREEVNVLAYLCMYCHAKRSFDSLLPPPPRVSERKSLRYRPPACTELFPCCPLLRGVSCPACALSGGALVAQHPPPPKKRPPALGSPLGCCQ